MLFFILFATLAWSALPGPNKCNASEVETCMLLYMDTNNDTVISVSEWNDFSLYHPCRIAIQRIAGSYIIEECDRNGNGVLDAADLIHRKRCVPWGLWEDICDWCTTCAALMANP